MLADSPGLRLRRSTAQTFRASSHTAAIDSHSFGCYLYASTATTYSIMMRPNEPGRTQPGPVRVGAAVDVIVGHLRRLVLLQAWAKWEPKLTQVSRPRNAFRCSVLSPRLLSCVCFCSQARRIAGSPLFLEYGSGSLCLRSYTAVRESSDERNGDTSSGVPCQRTKPRRLLLVGRVGSLNVATAFCWRTDLHLHSRSARIK